MSKLLSPRVAVRVLVLVGLVAGIVGAVTVDTGVAAPCQSNTQEFYSDQGCVTHVGTRYVNCSPPYIVQEGQTNTPYRITYMDECCGSCGSCNPGVFYNCG